MLLLLKVKLLSEFFICIFYFLLFSQNNKPESYFHKSIVTAHVNHVMLNYLCSFRTKMIKYMYYFWWNFVCLYILKMFMPKFTLSDYNHCSKNDKHEIYSSQHLEKSKKVNAHESDKLTYTF